MKKLNELVTSTEKPEHKAKRKAITFGSFKRAEDKQVQERKDREHQAELARIAEEARIQKVLDDEEARVIKEEHTRKRNETITKKLSNVFGTKTEIDYKPIREQVIDKYLPQLKEPETLDDYPKPFVAEPALNAELAEFKKKINEHLHKVGFASSSGGGAGSFADLDDVDPTTAKVNGKTIQFDSSTNKFVGADVTAGALAADNLTAGDAAINLTTTSGNITIDATANNSDIIFKGTDATSDITMLTLDGSEAGAAIFNAGLVIADAGNIGSASDTDAIAIASTGVVTMNQIPVFSAGINVSGGTIAGTLATAAQSNITSLGTLTTLTVDSVIINGTTIGHTSDSDAITIASDGDVTFSQDVIITGDFTVNGTTTTVSSTNTKVADTLLELNTGAGSNANDMGIIMERGSTGNNAIFMFDESADEFTVGLTTATNDATGNISVTAGTFTAATLKGNLVVADDGDIGSASATDAMQISSGGIVTFKDDILIKDTGTIGSASDPDAIAIAANGVVTFSQIPVMPANSIDSDEYIDGSIDKEHLSTGARQEVIAIACGDESTAHATGTAAVTFAMPYAFTLTGVKASVTVAPVGSTMLIDINEAGTTILSTKLMIDASEKISATAATAAVISDTSLADNALITIDIDQIGSSTAGAGLKVYLIGYAT